MLAIENISKTFQDAGFTHIKLEVEVNGNFTGNSEPERIECDNCDGNGNVTAYDSNDNRYDVPCAQWGGDWLDVWDSDEQEWYYLDERYTLLESYIAMSNKNKPK